ncbi:MULTISPECIES: transposase [unclassified Acidovorax]|uniref:transposase n=2 Tax=Acidovorax TaxID=12916 RepID=UPI00046336B3|nr:MULTISPECIES: transposase [unclassified Acidovorax]HQS22426.1 transposase [Acidovorax defluvii]OYY26955.1 MAG: transposase [Acidovorax sp. 35-64-16]OYY82492.1 MAG: transposase [Acidovorax sp. 28-64-14]OYZ67481.1 MAG: transposase [Acidovorax sp. 24-64-9]OZA68892.1 MAG: transposase [Acidovorax sp. 39-64-12]
MARLPRLTLPGYPHHIIQRGNNRQMIFADTQDFATMMALLAENAHKFAVAVHAYVLMDNHFHLLATPATAEALPLMMQAVGRSYVRYFNQRHARSGTLWEGRYRSTLIETERYLLACMVYIDLNPVRAGMVAQPGAWQWSSHAHYLGQRIDKLVTPHALYWALGNTPFAREAAYAGLVQAGIGSGDQAALTEAALSGWALGDAEFVAELQKKSPRRVAKAKAGRPAITPKN